VSDRPRIFWRSLEARGHEAAWTPGWLPETPQLRTSLAHYLREEGLRDGWPASYEAADAAVFAHSYVAEDEAGDWLEVAFEEAYLARLTATVATL
jgi:hypothetical protein